MLQGVLHISFLPTFSRKHLFCIFSLIPVGRRDQTDKIITGDLSHPLVIRMYSWRI
jgi:hypothetical protein